MSSVPEFISEASIVLGVSPEVLRRCKVDSTPDDESVSSVEFNI